jgi:riboflavin synthase
MMFTGIVEEMGVVSAAHESGGDLRVTVAAGALAGDLRIGDSVAVSGCCLTVVAARGETFEVELSRETVAKTAPRWRAGARVNLERATRLGDRLGGHLVAGHVEGTGRVVAIDVQPGAHVITIEAPERLARYLIPKGSIAVDGVSMTVVDVGGPAGSSESLPATSFTLWVIPHTLAVTTLGELAEGDLVNLEADLIARHLERLVGMGALVDGDGDGDGDEARPSGLGIPGPGLPDPKPPPPPGGPPMPEPPRPPAPPPAPPIPEPPRGREEAGA